VNRSASARSTRATADREQPTRRASSACVQCRRRRRLRTASPNRTESTVREWRTCLIPWLSRR
jgi:hypothetical protein